MNSGIASNANELPVVAIWITRTWGGVTCVVMAVTIAATPRAIDIGTSRNSSAVKTRKSIASAKGA